MSPSPRTRDHVPHIKDSFTYMTLDILQLYSVSYVSHHLFTSIISHVHSYQSISHPPLAHPILTRTTHTSHSHPIYLTLHSTTPLYSLAPPTPHTHTLTILHFTPLSHYPSTLANYSPYAQIELILYHVLHISPHLIPNSGSSTSSNE